MANEGNSKRWFTVEQANAMLPLVRAITRDLMNLAQEVSDRKQRVDSLTAGRDLTGADPYSAELAEVERDLEKERERMREYVRELRQLGVEPKDPLAGLVDFPTQMEGQAAYLCWQYGESEISYWHTLQGGFAGRQPLLAGIGAAGDDSEAASEI